MEAQGMPIELKRYTEMLEAWFSFAVSHELAFLTWQKIKNPNYKGKWKTPWIDNPGIVKHTYIIFFIDYKI